MNDQFIDYIFDEESGFDIAPDLYDLMTADEFLAPYRRGHQAREKMFEEVLENRTFVLT